MPIDVPTETFRLAVAVGIGLLIGIERERRKVETGGVSAEGIRTFALIALTGGIAQLLGGQLVLVAGALAVGAIVTAAYVISAATSPGITTEVASVATYLLGALAITEPAVAGAGGVVVAVLLAFRQAIHTFVRTTLNETEVRDALVLAGAALVILPLLPSQALDPYGVVNPAATWRTVVLFMAISGAGYVAVRFFGPRTGLPVAGFFAGFVSSAAAVASMAGIVRRTPTMMAGAVGGAVLASVASIVFLLTLVAATNTRALEAIAVPMGAAGGAAVAYSALIAFRSLRSGAEGGTAGGRAFDLRTAIGFAVAVTVISFVAAFLTDRFGANGLFLAATVAGFADTHATAIGAASLVQAGTVTPADAALGVTLAFTSNQVTKLVLAVTIARGRFLVLVGIGIVASTAAAWVGYLLLPK